MWGIALRFPELMARAGPSKECKESLSEAIISLILEDRRKDALKTVPKEAIREVVIVR